jgi:hypothetical protein
MKTKQIIRLLSAVTILSLICNCIEASKTAGPHDIQARPEKTKGIQSNVSKEFKTKTGKTIMISETHPVGQSLSTIKISTKDFEYNYSGIYKDRGAYGPLDYWLRHSRNANFYSRAVF